MSAALLASRRGALAQVRAAEPVTWSALSDDGVWTWFNDPRAVEHDGKLFTGLLRANGDVVVASLDLVRGGYVERTLRAAMEIDDHDNPAVLLLPDGRLACFYSRHLTDDLLRIRVGRLAGQVTEFEPEKTPIGNVVGPMGVSYANPLHLSAEDRVYCFSRTKAFLPGVAYTDDVEGLDDWVGQANLFDSEGTGRPYVKYATNGVDRIDFWSTTGHPRDVPAGTCHIYHWYYDATDASFHRSDGAVIKTLAAVMAGSPLAEAELTRVHDASAAGHNAWTWSIELDGDDRPYATYAVFHSDTDHRYRYAQWNGSSWSTSEIAAGGRTIYGTVAGEPQYSGGVVADPQDPLRVYLVRVPGTNGVGELEEYRSADGGATWTAQRAITSGSSPAKNFRPYVPRGRSIGPRVLWCRGSYTHYTSYATDIAASPAVAKIALPSLVAAPALTGTPEVGATLTATLGSWNGQTQLERRWRRNGAVIEGATGETFGPLTAGDVGDVLDVRVDASNAGGTVQRLSNAVTVVAEQRTFAEEVLADGPRVFLRFAETSGSVAADASPNDHDGTHVNGAAVGETGFAPGGGGVRYAAAAAQRTDLGTLGDFGSRLLTASFMFAIKTTQSDVGSVFGTLNDGITTGVSLHLNFSAGESAAPGRTMLYLRDDNGSILRADIAADIYDGAYHLLHWVVTSGSQIKCYVDGTEVAVTTLNPHAVVLETFTAFQYPMAIGARARRTDTPDRHLTGTLSEIAFFPTRLTAERIAAHWEARER